jgi:hypothetical protein
MKRFTAAKLTRLTHKIAIQLHLFAESCIFAVLAPGGQSGNFWIHRMYLLPVVVRFAVEFGVATVAGVTEEDPALTAG